MEQRSDSEGLKYSYDVLGALLEAAIRDQKLTGEAIASMNLASSKFVEQSRHLPGSVAAAVNNELQEAIDAAAETLTKRVKDANLEADRAAEAFGRATKRATFFVFIPVLLVTGLAMVIWYGVTAYLVHQLEQEKTRLQQKVNYLYSQGGQLDVRSCPLSDGRTAPCIRVESKGQNGYHVPIWVR
ncbi:hypothetical protein [Burkholderia vietnamiensis]|uniref:hypothetical protein n=1 Tax=Burkholderia vietnamiensis TaxID=60552 RepID=UPI00075B50F4|nr:hypothetical protein [Burkholderia vietnamiensis]KVF31173.1 hypothetical protein WJ09_19400 [Burkholderia vietnamiensis]